MLKKLKIACVTGSLLLICGCQSSSPLPQSRVVAVGCQPPPAPQAWYMESYEPTLTQRMLSELSPSPTKAIED
ncbi:hypothetical protein CCOS865_01844 [Pseudomonas reidholzensis]|uniref:Lipoprotein n=1 Tax=Pseudomonas reidholzensis TaxID=1785162 RepID=A0A383RR97_9PSED|nr:hypothetical protein CCOS865_01844 [Pseudomonas reidholzensis]